MSAMFAPCGKVRRAGDRRLLSGRWPFVSNVLHSGWICLGALIDATLGVPAERVLEAYAMVELNTPLMRCPEERYHVPPILEPWVFDEALVPRPAEEDVTGTFGFMDPTATSYPAFLATGDQVRLVRTPCACGLVGPAVVGEVRRTSGHEVRGCGGILATVRA